MGRGKSKSTSHHKKGRHDGGIFCCRGLSTWLMSGSSGARMRRFAFISVTIYILHSWFASVLYDESSSSGKGGIFPRFSLGVQQIVNDKSGQVVGNLYERKQPITYSTNIGDQTRDAYLREVKPTEEAAPGSAQSQVLWVLLHGALHDSSLWLKNGVAEMLATQGFRIVAVDMPGFGLVSDQKRVPANQMASFMESIRTELDAPKVSVVAPVMAGKFALPWLMNVPTSFSGFVAIDTIETERYPDEQYQSMPTSVSLLLLYGERDQVGVTAKKKMSLATNFQVEVIPNFGPNWYQEKTKDLKMHLSKFSNIIIDGFKQEEEDAEGEGEPEGEAGDGGGESFSMAQVQPAVPEE